MTDSNNQWNVGTLRESVDQRFADNQKAVETALLAQEKAVAIAFVGQEKAVSAALLAAKEAVIKAEILTDKRFDTVTNSVNEVADQTSDLMPRAEYVANHKALDDKIEVINTVLNKSSGERNLYATHADVAMAVEGIQATIKPVLEYVNRQQGQTQGSQLTMGKIGALLGIFTAVLGIMIYFVSQFSR